MNMFLSIVNLFFDPSVGPFGLPDEVSTNRPIEFLLFLVFLAILIKYNTFSVNQIIPAHSSK